MLSKKTFVEAMNAIIEHNELMEELMKPLQKLGDFPLSLDFESIHRKALLKVLQETMGDDSDWISWWLYDDVDKIVTWEEDEKKMSADLTTVEALYDFLLSNIEQASSEALPLTILKEDDAGNPRACIEKHDFLLFFHACLKHIDETNSTLIICEDAEPKYAVMLFGRQIGAVVGDYRNIWHIPCPDCGQLTDVKLMTQCDDADGEDLITHCPHCHLDWHGHVDKFGALHTLERHFWG